MARALRPGDSHYDLWLRLADQELKWITTTSGQVETSSEPVELPERYARPAFEAGWSPRRAAASHYIAQRLASRPSAPARGTEKGPEA